MGYWNKRLLCTLEAANDLAMRNGLRSCNEKYKNNSNSKVMGTFS
jgi:hypothetical protein